MSITKNRIDLLISKKQFLKAAVAIVLLVVYLLLLVQVRRYRDGSDWFFFVHLTRKILNGQGLSIYTEKEYGQYTFSYSPLSLMILAPVILMSDRLGLSPINQQIVNVFPFAVFDFLLAVSAVRTVKLYRKVTDTESLSILTFILFSFITLISSIYNGRFESMMLFFLLEGYRLGVMKKWGRASILLSLAILTKQTGLFALTPMFGVLLMENKKQFMRVVGTIGATIILTMLPFLVSDPQAVLSTLRSQSPLEIRGLTIWYVIKKMPPLIPLINWNTGIILGFQLLIFLWILKNRPKLDSPTLLGLSTLAVFGTFFLMRTVLSYYILFPFVFLFLWEKVVNRHAAASYVYLGVATMIYTLGSSRETTVFIPGVLTSSIVFVTGLSILIYIGLLLKREHAE